MIDSAPGSPKKPLILTGITAMLCLFLIFYIQSTSENTLNRYLPWAGATTNIKLETTLAHLWFEEYLSGDPDIEMEGVLQHLQKAESLTVAILDGRTSEQQTYEPLSEPTLRKQANQLLYQLASFKKETTKRLTSDELNNAGTQLDKTYDQAFQALIDKIDLLESNLQRHIQQEKENQDTSMMLLLITMCFMVGISVFSIGQFTLTRAKYLRQLSEANKRISEQNSQLLKSSQTDQLTGLPNRQMLVTIAKQILARVHRGQTCMSLTFIDLDFFKPINDQYGHSVGDRVLVNLTKTIQDHLREGDILARLAGDEFILILQDEEAETLKTSLELILNRIRKQLNHPIVAHPKEIHIRFSAGTAIAPTNTTDFEELLHLADLAMYESKKQGRGLHYFYCAQAVNPFPTVQEQVTQPEVEVATE